MTTEESKITIELSPFKALALVSFLTEFKEDFCDNPALAALNDAALDFSNQVMDKITLDQLEDAEAERALHRLAGSEPPGRNEC